MSDRKGGRGRPPKKKGARRPAAGERRALSQSAPQTHLRGDPEVGRLLERAFERLEGNPDRLTHAFHTYPAKMHPGLASSLVRSMSAPGDEILDPFCGSGTVLVEAMALGRRSRGLDLNPLALRIAEVKTTLRGKAARKRFLETAHGLAARSEERVRARVDARAPLDPEEARWYSGHVLKELAGLREEILELPDEDRRVFEIVFSSILMKVSKQRSDTAERETTRRIRKGLSTELFLRRARELEERWADLSHACREVGTTHRPRLALGDVRELPQLMEGREPIDLIVTSPPYAGTYDYVDHHARRYPWLGLEPTRLREGEIGARRALKGQEGLQRWDRELGDALRGMAAVLGPDGRAVLLLGDGQIERERVEAERQVERLAPSAGLAVIAVASQARRDYSGRRDRREHLIALRRS